ncbi:MAG: putative molybdenum carrier protein [Isosphaeraceae bacterium]
MQVITGGQTGVDQAGWRAAKRAGLPTGGFMPRNFKTEAGLKAELAEEFGARALESPSYAHRTIRNVLLADAVLVMGDPDSSGSRLTINTAMEHNREIRVVEVLITRTPDTVFLWSHPFEVVADWIREVNPRVLMVAGNRESTTPGIGKAAEMFLLEVFQQLRPPV